MKVAIQVELEIPDNMSPRNACNMVAEVVFAVPELHAMCPEIKIAKNIEAMVAYIEQVTGHPYQAAR